MRHIHCDLCNEPIDPEGPDCYLLYFRKEPAKVGHLYYKEESTQEETRDLCVDCKKLVEDFIEGNH